MDLRAEKKRNQEIKQKRWIENTCGKKDVLAVQDDIRVIGRASRCGKLETIAENDCWSRPENKWWLQKNESMKERIKEHEKKTRKSLN